MFHRTLLALVISALGGVSGAQGLGSSMPDIPLERFEQTEARSLDDLYGRAILLEFFAYW